jgi:hypothetical protein
LNTGDPALQPLEDVGIVNNDAGLVGSHHWETKHKAGLGQVVLIEDISVHGELKIPNK